MGEVTCEFVAPKPSKATGLIEEAFAVEAAPWKGRVGTALANNRALGEFFRSYGTAASREGMLRLCFLRIDGRPAAMLCAVEYKRRFWTFKIGYAETFASCSPGNLLVAEAIRYAARGALESFEFLGVVEDWIRVWTKDDRGCARLRFYTLGIEGTRALGLDTARYARSKVHRLLPPKTDRP